MYGLSASSLLRLGFHTLRSDLPRLPFLFLKGFLLLTAVLHLFLFASLLLLPLFSTPSQEGLVTRTVDGDFVHADPNTSALITEAIDSANLDPDESDRVWALVSSVGVRSVQTVGDETIGAEYLSGHSNKWRSVFFPVDGTVYVVPGKNALKQLIDEAPHVEQFRRSSSRSYWRWAKHAYRATVLSLITSRDAGEIYRESYDEAHEFEGEAHGPLKEELLQEHGLTDTVARLEDQE